MKRPRSKLKMLPQTPSRFTGMIGASTPFMMRSMPRRKGSSWPMRVIWPFGEDADDFAALDRVGGFAQRVKHFAGPQLGGNRNRANHFRERLDVRQIVNAFEHQESGSGDRSKRSAAARPRTTCGSRRKARRRIPGCSRAPRRGCDKIDASRPRARIAPANPAAGKSNNRGDQRQDRAVEENSRAV